jgi:outer membrane biosynthesis protein TonB
VYTSILCKKGWLGAILDCASCGRVPPKLSARDASDRCEDFLPAGAVRFSSRMMPPKLISGKQIMYTSTALEAGVEGTGQYNCVIAADGTVRQCRVIESLRSMDAVLLEALQSRRYVPALMDGKPVTVDYPLRVRLTLPKGARRPQVAPPSGATKPTAFVPGPMSRPIQISGTAPVYTRQAVCEQVEGLVVVRCTLALDGTLQNCRVLK